MSTPRCAWVNLDNARYVDYHDEDWGVPVHNDTMLFEMLVLEGAQAGLSWQTILNKREQYKKAFDGFDPVLVAAYDDKKEASLLQDAGIVRNRLKIKSAIRNAKVFLAIQQECGSFDAYIWAFVKNKPIQNTFDTLAQVPAQTPLSETIAKDLKKRGMNFIGPTIMYAYMQSIGMVNDHETSCFRYKVVS